VPTAQALAALAAKDQAAGFQPAVEIADPTGFINASSSFTLKSLIGKKVILLDFWTYSCINCIRTLPYLTAWDSRYASQGLEIVGIHTPEFDFEKDINNVQAAVQKFGINYPVILDSNYGTWNAYSNQYWPHEYLIDLAGYIVHDQIGEGNYDETEKTIQTLLAERDTILGLQPVVEPTSTVTVASSSLLGGPMSPETYFGAARNEYLGNGTQGQVGIQSFTTPGTMSADTLYLGGTWDIEPQFAITPTSTSEKSPVSVDYSYEAKGIYWVAGSANGSPIDVEVLRDGKPIDPSVAGADIFYKNGNSYVEITGDRLYRIVDDKTVGAHQMEFIINSPGLQAFTFTFG
jgi:thiol-disulfide isomerase/thioredoxin